VRYFANAGPHRGPVLYGATPEAIGVLEARDKPIPIGMALCVSVDALSCALWELIVHDAIVPGRWIVVDREFKLAE
jgi:hypothetical protein